MLGLEIDKNLICWTRLFFINSKLQLIINSHNNHKKVVKLKIPQGSLISSILFLIYINNVFKQFEKKLLGIVSLLFVDFLQSITSRLLVKKMAKTVKKVGKIVLNWEKKNVVIYNIAKTVQVIFFYI